MQRFVSVLVAASCLAACATRAPVQPAPLSAAPAAIPGVDVAIPGAENALDGTLDDAPVVSLVGDEVRVDGQRVDDVRAIESSGRMTRIDGLFNALKARREAWKKAHPGASFPGVAEFAFDGNTTAVVVKSVFQTTAYAGFPNGQLLVRTKGGVGRFSVDAQVPGPPRPGAPDAPETIQRVVRAHYDVIRDCYERALKRDPNAAGRVMVRMTIEADGSVSPAKVEDAGSTLTDQDAVACVLKAFGDLKFPAPGHTVRIVYPIMFQPSEKAPSPGTP